MGWLRQDVDGASQVEQLGEIYQACGNELKFILLPTATSPKLGVDIPPLVAQVQLLVDMHNSLMY